ncbi:hypothetical protein R5R35_003923 [Gryllus longicercus]|uniref:Uncharacterized protein n=1 Tax=Gryllus longicercus TaxID=2509291 RepID=A0AAN9VMT1_9ORTH
MGTQCKVQCNGISTQKKQQTHRKKYCIRTSKSLTKHLTQTIAKKISLTRRLHLFPSISATTFTTSIEQDTASLHCLQRFDIMKTGFQFLQQLKSVKKVKSLPARKDTSKHFKRNYFQVFSDFKRN